VVEEGAQHEPTMEEILSSIGRMISEDGEDEDEAFPQELPRKRASQSVTEEPPAEIMELTDMVLEDGTVVSLDLEVAEPTVGVEPEPAPKEDDRVTGLDEGKAIRNLMSSGSESVADAHGVPLGNGNRTIEDIVRQLLRPMLQLWLEKNLHGIVNRVVEREVSKFTDHAKEK